MMNLKMKMMKIEELLNGSCAVAVAHEDIESMSIEKDTSGKSRGIFTEISLKPGAEIYRSNCPAKKYRKPVDERTKTKVIQCPYTVVAAQEIWIEGVNAAAKEFGVKIKIILPEKKEKTDTITNSCLYENRIYNK